MVPLVMTLIDLEGHSSLLKPPPRPYFTKYSTVNCHNVTAAYAACNFSCRIENEEVSRQEAVKCIVKVVVYRNLCKTETLLLVTTDE